MPEGRAKISGTAQYWLPSFSGASVATLVLTANRLQYAPILITTAVTLDQLAIEVTASVASTNIELGLYNADKDWQPTTLVVDAGNVSAASAGVLTLSISQTLQPGRYLTTFISNGAPTVRILRGGITPIAAGVGASPFIKAFYVGSTYGSLASTGVAWTTTTTGTTPFEHAILLRVSAP